MHNGVVGRLGTVPEEPGRLPARNLLVVNAPGLGVLLSSLGPPLGQSCVRLGLRHGPVSDRGKRQRHSDNGNCDDHSRRGARGYRIVGALWRVRPHVLPIYQDYIRLVYGIPVPRYNSVLFFGEMIFDTAVVSP